MPAPLLQGVFVPIITPFTPDNEIDLVSFGKQAKIILGAGIDGLVVCGTTGEGTFLGIEEKKQLFLFSAELRKKFSKRFTLIAGTGAQDLKEATLVSKMALDSGFDAVLALPPRTLDQDEIISFYKALSSVQIPIIAYSIPWLSGTDILPETLGKLVSNRSVIGIKDSTQDEKLLLSWKRFSKEALVFIGGDKLIFSALNRGAADAAIPGTGNIAPRLVAGLFKLARNGRGQSEQRKLDKIVDCVLSTKSFFGSIKAVLVYKKIIGCELKREPQEMDLSKKRVLIQKCADWE